MVLIGKGSQKWMTDDYEEERKKCLLDTTGYSEEDQKELDVEFPAGRGLHNPETMEVKVQKPDVWDGNNDTETVHISKIDPLYGE